MSRVSGDDRHAVRDRRGGYPQIVSADRYAVLPQVAVRASVLPAHVLGDGKDVERLDELLPTADVQGLVGFSRVY